MANRVTAEDVKSILADCNATVEQIAPFITTANLYISTVFENNTSVSAATLKELEKWMTAHLVSVTFCRTTKTEEIGDVKVAYTGVWGTKLSATSYGQMVLQLDVSGEINKQSKRPATIEAITSFK